MERCPSPPLVVTPKNWADRKKPTSTTLLFSKRGTLRILYHSSKSHCGIDPRLLRVDIFYNVGWVLAKAQFHNSSTDRGWLEKRQDHETITNNSRHIVYVSWVTKSVWDRSRRRIYTTTSIVMVHRECNIGGWKPYSREREQYSGYVSQSDICKWLMTPIEKVVWSHVKEHSHSSCADIFCRQVKLACDSARAKIDCGIADST